MRRQTYAIIEARGLEASVWPVWTHNWTTGGGFALDRTINVGKSIYLGEVMDIRRDMVETTTGRSDIWGSIGAVAGPKLGITGTYSPTLEGYGILTREVNYGGGLPAGVVPVNAAAGTSRTLILKDFYE